MSSVRLKEKPAYKKRNVKDRQTTKCRYIKVLLGLVIIVTVVITANCFYPYTKVLIQKFNAKYGDVEFPKGEVRGIDVSRYQGEIDWEQLKLSDIQGAPISFVFIKATEGKDIVDKFFKYNFYKSRMNGVIRGAYHFYSTLSSAKEQADFFLSYGSVGRG